MKKFLLSSLIFLMSNALFAENIAELSLATNIGNELFSLVKANKELKIDNIGNGDSLNQYLKEFGCDGYNYSVYLTSNESVETAYIIGRRKNDFLVGRHFKATYKDGKVILETMKSSTKTCLNLGTPPANVESLITTHLEEYPNEFHVLQSKLGNITLYVGSSSGIYAVEEGPIRLVQKR